MNQEFARKAFEFIAWQPFSHPADGITHGAVIIQIKLLTYLS